MNLRIGLQGRFLIALTLMALLYTAIALGLSMQQRHGHALLEQASREAMHAMVVDGVQRRGNALAGQLSDALANPLYYFDIERISEVAAAALRLPDVASVRVYDQAGRLLHDGEGSPGGDLDAAQADMVAFVRGIAVGEQQLGRVEVVFSMLALLEHERRAQAVLGERLQAESRRQDAWLLALLALLLLSGGLMSLLISRGLVRPVRMLAEATRLVESGRYADARLASSRQDEIGDLIRAFSRMSESVTRHDLTIRQMAYGDVLTGLPNRLALRELLDQRLSQVDEQRGELALLFIDLDDFKRINDTLGHDAGDRVLSEFAARIRAAAVRVAGVHAEVGRFGGDEFIALVQGDDVRALASQVADALVAELKQPIALPERTVFLGMSIGITLYPADATDAAVLLKNGDVAMYQAKIAGKNCYRFYSRAMDREVERQAQIEHDLRGAWERGEMSLCYQPVHTLGQSRLAGAEALLRWSHPVLGDIPPTVFIDIAERSGIIEQLGRHALVQACLDAANWPEGPGPEPAFVSVNISARQLRRGDLPEAVVSALEESGLHPGRLHLELTETTILSDEAQASALLSRVRALGCKVWLDDFGTGFSGLSHLRRVPVDGVKIDRSFIADILHDPDDLALTTAIIAMGHSLGITVVAEGVEQEGQFRLLRERHCDLAQGFWLGGPVSASDFSSRLGRLEPAPPAGAAATQGDSPEHARHQYDDLGRQ